MLNLKLDGIQYQADLFIGENLQQTHITYDTRSSWTIITNNSFYNP